MFASLSNLLRLMASGYLLPIPARRWRNLLLTACDGNGVGQSKGVHMTIEIETPADAGFALLAAHRAGEISLTTRAAQFAGQLMASDSSLTDAQASWLDKLLVKAGMPPFFGDPQ